MSPERRKAIVESVCTTREEREEGVFTTEEANRLSAELWAQRQQRLDNLLDQVLAQIPDDAATVEALNWACRHCSHLRGVLWTQRE